MVMEQRLNSVLQCVATMREMQERQSRREAEASVYDVEPEEDE